MSSHRIIDSHIHIWPPETSNEDEHAWMTPDMPLARPHLLSDYDKASDEVAGVIFVETDVRYESPSDELAVWAKGPLDEIAFLRDVVEGHYGDRSSQLLLGLVPWVPMHQPTSVLQEYLALAEQRAGPETWKRVKGFRFLLQSIPDRQSFEKLVFSDYFIGNLKVLGERNLSFDVGVDQHSGGSWQLEAMARAMELAHVGVPQEKQVVFIINHLCKPDFVRESAAFDKWREATTAMSKCERTYMKLSGAFSELPSDLASTADVAAFMAPWFEHVLQTFGARRIMFGSDWPVSNVSRGEASWTKWREVVGALSTDPRYVLSAQDCESIWIGTAAEAYRVRYG